MASSLSVLSSSRKLIVSEFPDFNEKTTHSVVHSKPEGTLDFQFFALKPLFLEVNKNYGAELLRIKDAGDKGTQINRILKLQVDKLRSGACPKQGQGGDEIALGYCNGQIKLMNYITREFTTQFPSENHRGAVEFLDFNASNEYLSAIQENGIITLYGLKTKMKIETLDFDKKCEIARFHPTKRFHLAVGSALGSIFVHDIQSKQCLYQSLQCHASPCKDLCISPTQPDVLLTAGYDNIINIFDIRKRKLPLQLRENHPVSTITISICGTYFCAGNLKGEIISYDMRHTKNALAAKKVHDSAVERVAFVPHDDGTNSRDSICPTSGNLTPNTEEVELEMDTYVHSEVVDKRDSFFDYLEYHSYLPKIITNRISLERGDAEGGGGAGGGGDKRESFDWEVLSGRNVDFSNDYRISFDNRLSTGSRMSLDTRLSRGGRKSLGNRLSNIGKDNCSDLNDTEDEVNSEDTLLSNKVQHLGLLDMNNKKNNSTDAHSHRLSFIEEEKEEDIRKSGRYSGNNPNKSELDSVPKRRSSKNKTDIPANENNIILNSPSKEFLDLPDGRNSTPNNVKNSSNTKTLNDNNSKMIESQDILMELRKMRSAIDEQFDKLEGRIIRLENEIKYNAEDNVFKLFNGNYYLWRQQMEFSEEIHKSVERLMESNTFEMECLRLQRENEQLKRALLEQNIPK